MDRVRIGAVAQFCRGVSYKKEQARKTNADGFIAILRANNIEANRLNFDDLVYVSSDLIQKNQYISSGDIIITMSSGSKAHVGKVAIAQKGLNSSFGAFCGKLIPKDVLPKYLYYTLQSSSFRKHIERQCKGTNINNIRQSYILDYEIDLPSIAEQERIVTRIEELFSQLDASIGELKTAKARLKVYRKAVLKEAFNGALTKSEKLGYSTLGTYIEKPRYGTSRKCDYSCNSKSTAVYRIPNIDHTIGQISRQDIKYAEFAETELADLKLHCGDILIIRSNGSASLVGRAALVRKIDTVGTFAGYLMRLRIKDKALLNPKYLLYFLQSHEARVYIENKAKSTSGVHNINSSEISSLEIPVFRIDDQQSIVTAIESRLSVCDSIEKAVNTALQQAEALRQSILKKAFEGGL